MKKTIPPAPPEIVGKELIAVPIAVYMSGTRGNPGPHFHGFAYEVYTNSEQRARVISGASHHIAAMLVHAADLLAFLEKMRALAKNGALISLSDEVNSDECAGLLTKAKGGV